MELREESGESGESFSCSTYAEAHTYGYGFHAAMLFGVHIYFVLESLIAREKYAAK